MDKVEIKLPKDWKYEKFENLLDYIQPTKYIVESTEYSDNYKIPVLTAGKSFIKGYTNEKTGIFNDLPVIIFDDFTTANKFVNFPFKVKSSAMKILTPKTKDVNIMFVYYYMQTVKISFDTHKRYWISVFAKLPVPTPPSVTQQAIVLKIEELFSELDNSISNLKTAKQQLKTYRQSVLKWAFEGKLTNKKVKNGELPKGWKIVLINEIGRIKGGKRLPPNHRYSEEPTDYVYIMAGNLKDGTIKNNPTFIKEETYNALANYKVTGGEVYITIVGACIGDAGIIPGNIGKSILTENAAKIIELNNIENKYLALFINSAGCQAKIKSKILSATLGKLALNRIGTLEIPLPRVEEQIQIIQEIESRLSVADKMEESINQSLQQAEALRQSILKKAFEGKLV